MIVSFCEGGSLDPPTKPKGGQDKVSFRCYDNSLSFFLLGSPSAVLYVVFGKCSVGAGSPSGEIDLAGTKGPPQKMTCCL